MTISVDISYNESTVIDPVSPTVYVKSEWQHAWQLEPLLTCQRLTFSTGEKDSQAVIRSHYGKMSPQNFLGFTDIDRLNFIRFYVQVRWTPNNSTTEQKWTGVIVASQDTVHGATSTVSSGDFSFVAFGLEWFLRRYQVTDSIAIDDSLGVYGVPVGLPFNAGGGNAGEATHPAFGNKRPEGTYPTSYPIFYDADSGSEQWTAYDILRYLARFHNPWTTGGLRWQPEATLAFMDNWHIPRNVITHGRTLREIIDQVIDRRRGLSYSFRLDETANILYLDVHSVYSEDIVLPSGSHALSNSRILEVTMDSARRTPVIQWLDHTSKYEQVVAFGARKTRTLTLRPGGPPEDGYYLEADWTSDQESDYFVATTLNSSYGDWDASTKELNNESYWMTYPVRRVFTHFKLRSQNEWERGLQLSLTTPMVQGEDYSTNAVEAADTSVGEYIANVAFIPIGDRYVPINDMSGGNVGNENVDANGLKFHCNLQEYENKRGVIIMPSEPAHVIAQSTVAASTLPQHRLEPVCDYLDAYVTITVEENERLSASYPTVPDAAVNNTAAKHLINLGDDVRSDYLDAGTVIGVDSSGSLQYTTYGGYLRNDSDFAADVARLAYEWYKTERQAIRFELNYISADFQAGDLVTGLYYGTLGQAVNTVISTVSFDFDSQQTSINTDLAEELDFRALARS